MVGKKMWKMKNILFETKKKLDLIQKWMKSNFQFMKYFLCF